MLTDTTIHYILKYISSFIIVLGWKTRGREQGAKEDLPHGDHSAMVRSFETGKQEDAMMDQAMPKLLRVLAGQPENVPPVWLMRQAGRYLPEYRELRAKTSNFLEFCYTPDIAVEATLQPIRRFGFDAAILFSDILVVPHGLGQKVWFEAGEGPRLETEALETLLPKLSADRMVEFLQPVYAAVRGIRAALPKETALIGFSGAPWTLACYMLEGKGSRDYPAARRAAYAEPERFAALMAVLEQGILAHCTAQIEAGAQVMQLFDSWAGAAPNALLQRVVIEPTARLVSALRQRFPQVPVIGFPKGIGAHFVTYAALTGVQGMGVDYHSDLKAARDATPAAITLQGNLDPELLASAPAAALTRCIRHAVEAMEGRHYIFNLGHGILPHTPIAQVEVLLKAVRG